MNASWRSPTAAPPSAADDNEAAAAVVIGKVYSKLPYHLTGYPDWRSFVPKPDIDLSFARYVAARKGEVAARSREGAAYAYAGDIKVRAALDRVRPVTLAVEATVRLWQTVEKSRMLGTAVKVTVMSFATPSLLATFSL